MVSNNLQKSNLKKEAFMEIFERFLLNPNRESAKILLKQRILTKENLQYTKIIISKKPQQKFYRKKPKTKRILIY